MNIKRMWMNDTCDLVRKDREEEEEMGKRRTTRYRMCVNGIRFAHVPRANLSMRQIKNRSIVDWMRSFCSYSPANSCAIVIAIAISISCHHRMSIGIVHDWPPSLVFHFIDSMYISFNRNGERRNVIIDTCRRDTAFTLHNLIGTMSFLGLAL